MKGGLVADESDQGGVESSGETCCGRDIAVDAREASIGKAERGNFGEEKVVGIANRHAVAEKNRSVGGEGANGVRFGEKGGFSEVVVHK